ncbi:hypothetical protein KIH74_22955 [Kineosporia sp. J2-2]|uniref:Scaffolding protein n=1 Tax=Kineosporia corallincola TaxID=2835133 RepID=A0ABS5TQD4_9ACTN|nr:hypothetical protein [Kineosporia corallincola]MBT0771819.1 hypothetical protein [Kineosporia corallincola]
MRIATASTAKLTMSHEQKDWLAGVFAKNRAIYGDARMSLAAPEPEAQSDPETSVTEPRPFGEMTADEKVEFLLAKTRKQEDALKGKTADPDARAQAKRIREMEKQLAEANELKASLEAASQTEAERAVKKAAEEGQKMGREAALAEARKTYGSQLVGVKIDAAAERKGMTPEQMRTVAGDLSRFLDDDGVDDDAVKAWIDALPDKAAVPEKLSPGDLGGGKRESAKLGDYERGRLEAQQKAERQRKQLANG